MNEWRKFILLILENIDRHCKKVFMIDISGKVFHYLLVFFLNDFICNEFIAPHWRIGPTKRFFSVDLLKISLKVALIWDINLIIVTYYHTIFIPVYSWYIKKTDDGPTFHMTNWERAKNIYTETTLYKRRLQFLDQKQPRVLTAATLWINLKVCLC